MSPTSTPPPSATEYYKSWTAYDALQSAAEATSYRSVFALLNCKCCPVPEVWSHEQPLLPVPPLLAARIRWYDNVEIPPSTTRSPSSTKAEDGDDGSNSSTNKNASMIDLQAHFVGHHQRIELILHYLKPSVERIYTAMHPFKNNNNHTNNNNNNNEKKCLDEDMPENVVTDIINECEHISSCWYVVGELVRGVARMDRMDYLAYVPRLAGVSGGNSPNMMSVTARTYGLESLLVEAMSNNNNNNNHNDTDIEAMIATAIKTRTKSGRIAEAFVDCLDALSRCWFEHVVTALTPIGLTRGTKGTPNAILVDRVLKRLHNSSLLAALGSLRSPISGIGVEMRQLYSYKSYPLAEHYLDLFVDPGPEFGSHNVGWLPKAYDTAREEYLKIRRVKRTAIWEHYYNETRPAFCQALRQLLGIDDDVDTEHKSFNNTDSIGFGLGSSVTEVLSRIVLSFQVLLSQQQQQQRRDAAISGATMTKNMEVILPEDDFLTIQRTSAILGRAGASIIRVPSANLKDHVLRLVEAEEVEKEKEDDDDDDDEKKESTTTTTTNNNNKSVFVQRLVLFSLVNSCTQQVQDLDWVCAVPKSTAVVIDLTQAIANIPLSNHVDSLATRPNVFFVGSLIKHARCGEGLGFMTYCNDNSSSSNACGGGRDSSLIITEPASGWAAFPSGLKHNFTSDSSRSSGGGDAAQQQQQHRLYYDKGLEWEGGTPSLIESAYVAVRILKSMPPVQVQHAYVKELQAEFLKRIGPELFETQLASITESNTLALPVSREVPSSSSLPFGLDYKVVGGITYLRIGFGIHNLEYHLDALIDTLTSTGALK